MSLRGIIAAPVVSFLVGLLLNQFPPEIVTESQFYREDRFGLRSALQHAHEHVVTSVGQLAGKVAGLKDIVLERVTGAAGLKSAPPPDPAKPPSNAKTKEKGKEKKKGGKEGGKNPGRGTATRLFTKEELAEYDGSDAQKGTFLAILGHVFDVSRGQKYYGPGGGYAFFAGRDGSRAFVSGDFTEAGLTDDVTGLAPADFLGLEEWMGFYRKEYGEVGRLVGRFFDETGRETDYARRVQGWLAQAHKQRKRDDGEKQVFPPCNSEWTEARGGRVYCSPKSGGISRGWAGVPRQYFAGGKKRCACVRASGPPSSGADPGTDRGDLDHPQLREYPGCPPDADSCAVKS